MKKSPSSDHTMEKRKIEKKKKSSILTEPEMEAALQLIQLSSGDDSDDYNCRNKVLNDEESESEGISSALNLNSNSNSRKRKLEIELEDEDDRHSRRSKKKFRSIVDIYINTKPLLNRRISDYKVR